MSLINDNLKTSTSGVVTDRADACPCYCHNLRRSKTQTNDIFISTGSVLSAMHQQFLRAL
jgi:hypothetical protein